MARSSVSSLAADAKPRAQLTLSEAGLPKLANGQTGSLFFRRLSLPTLRRGQREAGLGQPVGNRRPPQGEHFAGLASLEENELTKPKQLALRVGMRGEARIVIGQRTMIEYAFEPIRQLRENMGH